MPGRVIPLILASAMLFFAGGIAIHAQTADQALGVGQSPSAGEADRLLVYGLFPYLKNARSVTDAHLCPASAGNGEGVLSLR